MKTSALVLATFVALVGRTALAATPNVVVLLADDLAQVDQLAP